LYLEKLARHLARQQIRTDVAVECTHSPVVAQPIDDIRRVRYFGLGSGEPRRFPAGMVLWFATQAHRYDIVHFHAFVDRSFLFHLIARLSGCRVVQSCTLDDGLAAVIEGYRPLYRPLLRRLCRLIDVVIAISPRLHADNLAVLPAGRTRLIPQGVDVGCAAPDNDRTRCRARWGFGNDDVVLLFLGGMCARKDVGFLIDNHAAVAAGHGRVKLLLIGPQLEEGYLASLHHAIARSPCANDIILEGYMDDPTPAYAAADMFVFASRDEGFGNVLIEAMERALPVVSHHIIGVTDTFIEDSVTGYLFRTAAEYQRVVRSLVVDAARRRSMGQAARAAVLSRFNLRVIATRYADVYRTLVAEQHGTGGGQQP